LAKDLTKLQTSLDAIFGWKALLFGLNRHFEQFKKSLESGVKMRCIAFISETEEIPLTIQVLNETGNFEIKSASTNPKAAIDIHDKKIVHIITFPSSNLNGIDVLRSHNRALVELLQDYFDVKWQSATTPCWHKKNQKTKTKP
jgi:hypothetical protein